MTRVQDLLKRMEEEGTRWVDMQFVDLAGFLQHISFPAHEISADTFTYGIGNLDASRIKGFQPAEMSDMLLVPDPDTFVPLPWEERTARMFADLRLAGTRSPYVKDPRNVVQRAADASQSMGFSNANFAAEPQFNVFDSVVVSAFFPHRAQSYIIESREAAGNSFGTNYPFALNSTAYPAPPKDQMHFIRLQLADLIEDSFGITVESHHHMGASAGHCAITMRHAPVKAAADNAVTFRYVVKSVAAANNAIATFMPKPLYGEPGNAMNLHMSLSKSDANAFFDENDARAGISQMGRYFMGGILEHGTSLCAFTNPTTNSYKRLAGDDISSYLCWGTSNRTAALRVPLYYADEKLKHVEYRVPDSSANPYLAFSAVLAAGLDGIKAKIEPGDPVEDDCRKLDAKAVRELQLKELPTSLEEALAELESDSKYLKGIFSQEILGAYIELKADEAKEERSRPSPHEFQTYLGI